ncbi:hypothetical protein ScPMuIL_004875 [Solemya velum]
MIVAHKDKVVLKSERRICECVQLLIPSDNDWMWIKDHRKCIFFGKVICGLTIALVISLAVLMLVIVTRTHPNNKTRTKEPDNHSKMKLGSDVDFSNGEYNPNSFNPKDQFIREILSGMDELDNNVHEIDNKYTTTTHEADLNENSLLLKRFGY